MHKVESNVECGSCGCRFVLAEAIEGQVTCPKCGHLAEANYSPSEDHTDLSDDARRA